MNKNMANLLATMGTISAMGYCDEKHISETDRKIEELEYKLKQAKRKKHKMKIKREIDKLKRAKAPKGLK